MIKKIARAIFTKPKNRLSETSKRFIDKLDRALGPNIVRVFGRRGSKQRRRVNLCLLVLIGGVVGTNPEAQKLCALLFSQAKSSLHSLISETVESSSSTSTLESSSRSKYTYFIIGAICLVANSILWQYDENGQIGYRFSQSSPEPDETSYVLQIAEKIYDAIPEPINQWLVAVAEILGIFGGLFLFKKDLVHGGPITSFLEIIINLFK